MKVVCWIEPSDEKGDPKIICMTPECVIKQHRISKESKANKMTDEELLEDFKVIHWAFEANFFKIKDNNIILSKSDLHAVLLRIALNGPDDWGNGDIHEIATEEAAKRNLGEPDENCYVLALIKSVMGSN